MPHHNNIPTQSTVYRVYKLRAVTGSYNMKPLYVVLKRNRLRKSTETYMLESLSYVTVKLLASDGDKLYQNNTNIHRRKSCRNSGETQGRIQKARLVARALPRKK